MPAAREWLRVCVRSQLKRGLPRLIRVHNAWARPNPAVQAASTAAWNDEAHVVDNRRQYTQKFAAVTPRLRQVLDTAMPDAGFYLWARTPIDDGEFARRLLADYNVVLLPGSTLARSAQGINPGAGFVRIALVAPLADCVEAAERIHSFVSKL